jgi:hypothetical protein
VSPDRGAVEDTDRDQRQRSGEGCDDGKAGRARSVCAGPAVLHLAGPGDYNAATVLTWKLLRARLIKHTSGPLNAKGTDVAMEELTLAYERLELE